MNICNKYREEIQNFFDNNFFLSKITKKHIKKCNECKKYFNLFLKIKNEGKKEIDNKISKKVKFNFSFINKEEIIKMNKDKIFPFRKYLTIAAIFLIILLCSFFISLHIKNQKALEKFMIDENREYITELLKYTLDNIEKEDELYGLSTSWFDGVELVNEIMGEFTINNDYYFEKE